MKDGCVALDARLLKSAQEGSLAAALNDKRLERDRDEMFESKPVNARYEAMLRMSRDGKDPGALRLAAGLGLAR